MHHDDDVVQRLDELRLGLLTDLSHQLRTPVTAMKLALDGLLDQLHGVMSAPQRRLASITRRNIERIVTLVESQLELLQMAAGDVTISRRLVDVAGVVESAVSEFFGGDEDLMRIRTVGDDTPAYVFTDPDRIRSVVGCLVCGGPPRARRDIEVDYDAAAGLCTIVVRARYLGVDEAAAHREQVQAEGPSLRGVPPLSRLDFERRAYATIVGALGGEVEMERDQDHKRVHIRLPVYPEYDREKDFLGPVRTLQRFARDSQTGLAFLRCDVDGVGGAQRDSISAPVADLIERCGPVLSGSDCLVRSRQPGSFYLVLTNRSREELAHIRDYLGYWADEDAGESLFVSRPQVVVEDPTRVDLLLGTIEVS